MKYYIIQNIITPYRVSLFNKLAELNLEFEVLYMSENELDRSWTIDTSIMKYPHIVFGGYYKYFKGFHLHWNWQLIKYVMLCPENNIIAGGSWNDLNVMVICLLHRLRILKNNIIFWAEANPLTIGAQNKSHFRDRLRKIIYQSGCQTMIVPGKMSTIAFETWKIPVRNFIFLPNVIEEEKFNKKISFNSSLDHPVFVFPCRLIENLKGILNFFGAIGISNTKKSEFYICGDGKDRSIIEDYVHNNNLQNNIHIIGWCDASVMIEYYKLSNAFLLPSYSDPSPLSLVEAICSELPLLISNHCGNHFETLTEEENGYSFDPCKPKEICLAYEKLISRFSEWKEMGVISRKHFEANFEQKTVLPRFINQLKACSESSFRKKIDE